MKLNRSLDWVTDFGVNTTDVELYGETYSGYVWARVSHSSLYAVAGYTLNNAPNNTDTCPSQAFLMPANKALVSITINGATDQDGDQVTITIIGITSNEPITGADAYGVGTDTAWL